MTCKDCTHYKVCKIIDMAGIWERAELCECFKAADLVVELPCKVGDTVYDISWNQRVRDCKIASIYQEADGTWKALISPFCGGEYYVDVDAIGKTRFLTRAEAEKALEGMK